MKRPAIFFDRDNTLIVGNEYLGDPEQVQLMDGAAAAVARARELGFAVVVISNQSGVARGYFDETAVQAVNQRMEDLLLAANANAVIDRQEYCPFHPEAVVERYKQDSDLRKPKPGMFFKASHALALDLDRSWMVGDAPRDVEAGAAAGCRTVLFLPPGLPASPAALETPKVKPDYVVASLAEAMQYITEHMDGQPRPTMKLAEAAPEPAAPPSPTTRGRNRTELLLEQILAELKSSDTQHVMDFSISKLLAGIVQIVALAIAFLAFIHRGDPNTSIHLLFGAIFFQMLTVALLIMGRQR